MQLAYRITNWIYKLTFEGLTSDLVSIGFDADQEFFYCWKNANISHATADSSFQNRLNSFTSISFFSLNIYKTIFPLLSSPLEQAALKWLLLLWFPIGPSVQLYPVLQKEQSASLSWCWRLSSVLALASPSLFGIQGCNERFLWTGQPGWRAWLLPTWPSGFWFLPSFPTVLMLPWGLFLRASSCLAAWTVFP